jgi:hypothetical protein
VDLDTWLSLTLVPLYILLVASGEAEERLTQTSILKTAQKPYPIANSNEFTFQVLLIRRLRSLRQPAILLMTGMNRAPDNPDDKRIPLPKFLQTTDQ